MGKQIFDVLLNTYSMDNLLGYSSQRFNFWGILSPADFLGRLYNLEQVPSLNKKYNNAKEAVEIAISDSEEKALQYIKENCS